MREKWGDVVKVALFNTLYFPNQVGGAEKSVQLLAEGLQANRIKPIVITTSDRDYVDYVNGVKVYYVKMINSYLAYHHEKNAYKKPFWHLLDAYNPFMGKVEEILRVEKPDLVHTNNLAGFSVNVWRTAKKSGLPVLHTLRDYYLLCPSCTMFKNMKNCEKQCRLCRIYSLSPKILSNRYVDGVVGVSRFILDRHMGFGYFDKAEIKMHIYNPVSPPALSQGEKEKIGDLVFGLVGLISPAKGTEFVLRRFRKLNLPNTKLFVYGRGVTKNYEKDLDHEYGSMNIVFKGFRKAEEIYDEIDIAIIPSLWQEPFPRVLIESYSHQKPVIASKRGGIPENVMDGETGLLFDPDKASDFEKKLLEMVEKFGKYRFRFDVSKFSREVVADEYAGLYGKILSRGANKDNMKAQNE